MAFFEKAFRKKLHRFFGYESISPDADANWILAAANL